MAKKPFKVVSLFDIHYWEHIDLKTRQFIKDEQPNEIILGWDQLDLFTISKYYKWDVEEWIYKARQEMLEFKKFLKHTGMAWGSTNIGGYGKLYQEKPENSYLITAKKNYKDYDW